MKTKKKWSSLSSTFQTPSTTTKHMYLTVRGSGQVCSSSSMISGGSKPNRVWLHLYLTQHQSGGAFLAVSRASVRDALLQPESRSRPLALLFLSASLGRKRDAYRKRRSAPPCAHTQDLSDGITTKTRKRVCWWGQWQVWGGPISLQVLLSNLHTRVSLAEQAIAPSLWTHWWASLTALHLPSSLWCITKACWKK